MRLQDIKEELGIPTLELRYVTDRETGKRAIDEATGEPSKWMRHWDNDNRVAISIHEDTVNKLKSGDSSPLGLQSEVREGSQGEYTAHRIVMYSPSDATL